MICYKCLTFFICFAGIFLYVPALFDLRHFSSNSISDVVTSENLKLELILILLLMINTLGWLSNFFIEISTGSVKSQ